MTATTGPKSWVYLRPYIQLISININATYRHMGVGHSAHMKWKKAIFDAYACCALYSNKKDPIHYHHASIHPPF